MKTVGDDSETFVRVLSQNVTQISVVLFWKHLFNSAMLVNFSCFLSADIKSFVDALK